MVEEPRARAEVVHPQFNSGTVSYRLKKPQLWQKFKAVLKMSFDDFMRADLMSITANLDLEPQHILVDDGTGREGECPVHHYPHTQIFPLGKEPMRCHEAMRLLEQEAHP